MKESEQGGGQIVQEYNRLLRAFNIQFVFYVQGDSPLSSWTFSKTAHTYTHADPHTHMNTYINASNNGFGE